MHRCEQKEALFSMACFHDTHIYISIWLQVGGLGGEDERGRQSCCPPPVLLWVGNAQHATGACFLLQEGDEEQGPSAVPQPAPLLSELCFRDKAVVQMAAGHRHCLFLTVDGQVYCAGGGGSGQCGQGKEEDEPVPVFLNSLPEEVLDCVYVAAGGNTSACLSSE